MLCFLDLLLDITWGHIQHVAGRHVIMPCFLDLLLDITWRTTMNHVSYIFANNLHTKLSGSYRYSDTLLWRYEGTDYDDEPFVPANLHCSNIIVVII